MPHSIDTIFVQLKETLSEFGVDVETSSSIGANALVQILDAIYYASPSILMQSYTSSLDFRQAALEEGAQYEKCIRSLLGMPPVRSFPEQDEIIAGLANHLGDVITVIAVLKEALGYPGVGEEKIAQVDAAVVRARNFLISVVEGEKVQESLPPTRFEREDVL